MSGNLSIEEAIERLIALLDAMEPDADAMPSLGRTDPRHLGGCDDREDECEDEGAQCEDEGAINYDPPGFIWGGNEEGEGCGRRHRCCSCCGTGQGAA